jgi:hypothetical protein
MKGARTMTDITNLSIGDNSWLSGIEVDDEEVEFGIVLGGLVGIEVGEGDIIARNRDNLSDGVVEDIYTRRKDKRR